MELLQAGPEQIEEVRKLFREYEEYLGCDLCFQDFQEELDSLPGAYSPPDGALILAVEEQAVAGCVALRGQSPEGVCEMKRLFVRSPYRGTGLGRKLAEEVIRLSREKGYSLMRLDTLDRLEAAMKLYESLGFRVCEPYYPNPLDGVVYWELRLD
jgi:ribosomal protein S18 acetylase RimI-like enzyme